MKTKKVICMLLSVVIMVTSFAVFPLSEGIAPLSYLGNVDQSDNITATDALIALQYAVGKVTLGYDRRLAADANLDGTVNATDALLILQHSVGKIDLGDRDVTVNIKDEAVTYNFEDDANGDTRTAYPVQKKTKYGMRFFATATFDAIEASYPSYADNVGSITVSLYKWLGNFEDTIDSEAVCSEKYVDFADCETIKMSFEEQERGEYLWLLSEGLDGVGIWIFTEASDGTLIYDDGVESKGCFQGSIHYTYTPREMKRTLRSATDLSKKVTTPPEVVYPEDHPIYTLDAKPGSYVATDGLGRTLPESSEVGTVKKNKFVGMFYWTWHSSHSVNKTMNVNDFINRHPELKNDYNNSLWSETGATIYHWNEPVYGYYDGTDEWVIRRQAEMLANAGVDVIFFDNTNATATFKDGYNTLLRVFEKARLDGVKTPKIAFLLPFSSAAHARTQIREIYLNLYRADRYRDLWFYWEGKPLIMAYKDCLNVKNKDQIDNEIAEFFTFRAGQPVYNAGSRRQNTEWGWLSVYPQTVYYRNDGTPEMTTVGVAQNWSKALGLTAMNGKDIFGRTYTSKGYDTRENAKLYGANFTEQWEYALKVDPEFVFVTGWNEWVAGRYQSWYGVNNAFPDQFNDEFSRDIEPSKGDLKDHYYYQLCDYIRRFKGTEAIEKAGAKKTVDINGDLSQWNDVTPEFRSYRGNTGSRDADGYKDLHYNDNTGRNDIVSAKISRDDEYLYFLVKTDEDLTSETDNAWMRLFIDTGDGESSWEGYEYMVGRTGYGGGKSVLERSTGGWNWEKCGDVEYTVKGNALQLKIKRSDLGFKKGAIKLNFKWSDNMQTDGDIMDFYVSGDVAPGGRFNFAYRSDD